MIHMVHVSLSEVKLTKVHIQCEIHKETQNIIVSGPMLSLGNYIPRRNYIPR